MEINCKLKSFDSGSIKSFTNQKQTNLIGDLTSDFLEIGFIWRNMTYMSGEGGMGGEKIL